MAALTIGLVGCNDEPTFIPSGDSGTTDTGGGDTVPTTDSGGDAAPGDTSADVESDATGDTEPADTEADVEPDLEADTLPDVEFDSLPDAEFDTEPDLEFDVEPDIEPDADPDVEDPLAAAREAVRRQGAAYCAILGSGCAAYAGGAEYDEELCLGYLEEYLPEWESYGLDCLIAQAELLECFAAGECTDGVITEPECFEEGTAVDRACF